MRTHPRDEAEIGDGVFDVKQLLAALPQGLQIVDRKGAGGSGDEGDEEEGGEGCVFFLLMATSFQHQHLLPHQL